MWSTAVIRQVSGIGGDPQHRLGRCVEQRVIDCGLVVGDVGFGTGAGSGVSLAEIGLASASHVRAAAPGRGNAGCGSCWPIRQRAILLAST